MQAGLADIFAVVYRVVEDLYIFLSLAAVVVSCIHFYFSIFLSLAAVVVSCVHL